MKTFGIIGLILAGLSSSLPAMAQDRETVAQLFSGAWRVFDAEYNDGGPCTIALQQTPVAEALVAQQAYCRGGLAAVSAWTVDNGQLVLLDGGFGAVARLGGNQNRISGEARNGRMVILERTSPGDAEPTAPDCLYLGYGDTCAEATDRAALRPSPGTSLSASTLVVLRLREQPRPDATPVGTIDQGACLAVSECRDASDGPWCKASVQGLEGWARRHAIRLEQFPVLTYRPGC